MAIDARRATRAALLRWGEEGENEEEDKMFEEAKLWHDSAEKEVTSKQPFPGGISIEPLVVSSFTVEEKDFVTLEYNLIRTIYIEVA